MIAALIVAAGRGRRMGAELPKQYLPLAGKAILNHTLQSFDRCDLVTKLFLVVAESDLAYCRNEIIGPAVFQKPLALVAGGARRQDSVLNGLKAMGTSDGIVLIHDGVRPFISKALITACIAGAEHSGACIPAIPVFDTLKQIEGGNRIRATVPRDGLYMAQTPQAFRISLIMKAHTEALKNGWEATDDASLLEQLGEQVRIVPGDKENIKITTPDDLLWAEAYLKNRVE